jgi:hypothetical protein
VVAPELDHPFQQLTLRERGPVDGGLLQLRLHLPGVFADELRRRARQQRIARRHSRFALAVIDPCVVHLMVQPLLVSHRVHVDDVTRRQAHRRAPRQAQPRVTPRLRWRYGAECHLLQRRRCAVRCIARRQRAAQKLAPGLRADAPSLGDLIG